MSEKEIEEDWADEEQEESLEDDESFLEEALDEEDTIINSQELDTFLANVDIPESSPSLEKINAPQRGFVRLESGVDEGSFSGNSTKEADDPFNYNSSGIKSEDPKYTSRNDSIIGEMISNSEIENMGKGDLFERKEIGFQSSLQANNSPMENFKQYSPMSKTEKANMNNKDPFERKEIKYSSDKR